MNPATIEKTIQEIKGKIAHFNAILEVIQGKLAKETNPESRLLIDFGKCKTLLDKLWDDLERQEHLQEEFAEMQRIQSELSNPGLSRNYTPAEIVLMRLAFPKRYF